MAVGKPLASGEQHAAVRPYRVGFHPAAAMTLAGGALADFGDDLIGQAQRNASALLTVYCDPGAQQRSPNPAGIRRQQGHLD